MKYKILVLDLDGTLTNSRKEITDRTKHALKTYQKEGGIVVLASGRPTYGIMPLAEELDLKKAAKAVNEKNISENSRRLEKLLIFFFMINA